jgi:hypothetical protein
MVELGLNDNEIEILRILINGPKPIYRLAPMINISRSWCSRCVAHLVSLGLVRSQRDGRRSLVELDNGPVGNALAVLLTEDPMLDLSKVLAGQGLVLLPYLIGPGSSVASIVLRSGITSRSLRTYLRRWKDLGIVQVQKRIYSIHPYHPYLIEFLHIYFEYKMLYAVKTIEPKAHILWRQDDECLLSSPISIDDKRVFVAGPSALSQMGQNIIYSHRYYLYSHIKRKVTLEEALVQALRIDRVEPRLKRLLLKNLKARTVDIEKLVQFSQRYGIEDMIRGVMSNVSEESAQEIR